jgi:cytochrome oxidase Cu insertion factor (SCO1/SenC/PrrC family)
MNNPGSIEQAKPASKKNPYTPWFVVAAFATPVILAYGLFFFGVTPPGYSNRGELLSPVVDVEALALSDESDQPLSRDDITVHRWHMILFTTAACDDACNQMLYNMRQINIAVGKNAPRVRHMIVHLEQPDEEFQALIASEYADARRAYTDSGTIEAALKEVGPKYRSNEIYIMDPLGNIMLRFTQDQTYKDLMHDLNKMLKVSQIG